MEKVWVEYCDSLSDWFQKSWEVVGEDASPSFLAPGVLYYHACSARSQSRPRGFRP